MSSPVPPLDWPHYGIGLTAAVRRGFQKYATFSGRASRSEFWYWVLGNAIVSAVLYGLTIGLGLATSSNGNDFGWAGVPPMVLLGIWFLATIVPNIAITLRRLHDAGYSGWYYLLNLIPSVGGIIVLVFCALQTSPAAAKYGPPYPENYAPTGYAPTGYGDPNQGYGPPPGQPQQY